jgi:hypothetical protein
MRTLSLKVLTQNSLVKVETDVRTLGEFKKETVVKGLEIDWANIKLIDRASKNSYEVEDAVLPSVNAILFIMPTKSKAGVYSYQEAKQLVKEYKSNGGEVPFNYTQASAVKLNEFLDSIEVKGVEDEMVDTYTEPTIDAPEIEEIEKVEFIDPTTLDDLNEEAKALKRILK